MEKKKNVKRGLIASMAIIVLCLSIAVGVSYALFTQDMTVNNHLRAGKLEATLERVSLEYTQLTDEGVLKAVTNTTKKDFTNASGENVFDFDEAANLIVPGSYFDATMKLSNLGDVAFKYSIGIDLVEGDPELAEQLQLTLTYSGGSKTVKLGELANGLTIDVDTINAGESAHSFNVKVEFIDSAANNDAENQNVKFDLFVKAVQATA